MAANDNLSARKRRFVAALLTEPTILDAARACGLSERTAHRYVRDPAVKAALSAALDDVLAGVTRQTVAAMGAAVRTLAAIHEAGDMPPAARVSAARSLLVGGPALREAFDLGARVAALEGLEREHSNKLVE